MAYDDLIRDAIRSAVEESGQSERISSLLATWFQKLSEGDETLDDTDMARKRAEILYGATDPLISAESKEP